MENNRELQRQAESQQLRDMRSAQALIKQRNQQLREQIYQMNQHDEYKSFLLEQLDITDQAYERVIAVQERRQNITPGQGG